MSDSESKFKKSKRLYEEECHIKKRASMIKERSAYLWPDHKDILSPHRLHKKTGMNCGSSNCVMCGNPRKMFKEKTKQEQGFLQDRLWSEV